jgi:uncharacterized membrane protein YdjX (TVP38/TMEM64 family)
VIGEAQAMRRLIAFLTNLDARAWRTLAVSFVLLGGVGVVFFFGAPLLGISGEGAVEQWLGAAHGVWALPVAVSAFAVLAFLGVPQFVLLAAAAAWLIAGWYARIWLKRREDAAEREAADTKAEAG